MASLTPSLVSSRQFDDWELADSPSACDMTESVEDESALGIDAGGSLRENVEEEAKHEEALLVEANAPQATPQHFSLKTASDLPAPVRESIIVCIDRSGSMGTPFNEESLNLVRGARRQRTRMEAVKAMFYAFRDRAESLGREHGAIEMGLIRFDNDVDRLLELTTSLERFETQVDDMEKRGATAIFSAILEAAAMLEDRVKEDPSIDLRVLLLTDGQNNIGHAASQALREVRRIGAVVDAILVGHRVDPNLRKIVRATGGECYQIDELADGFELLESESVVSLRARRGGAKTQPLVEHALVELDQLEEQSILSSVTAASRRASPNRSSTAPPHAVISSGTLFERGCVETTVSSASSSVAVRRVLQELKQVASGDETVWMHGGEGVHIFPAPENVKFWRALIEGPSGSPYEGGVFALKVTIPDAYPLVGPSIVFETPVYHCNVSSCGSLCMSWPVSFTVPQRLESIRSMLARPDPDQAVRQWVTELTMTHQKTDGKDNRYFEKAKDATRQHASKTVEEWRMAWECGTQSPIDS